MCGLWVSTRELWCGQTCEGVVGSDWRRKAAAMELGGILVAAFCEDTKLAERMMMVVKRLWMRSVGELGGEGWEGERWCLGCRVRGGWACCEWKTAPFRNGEGRDRGHGDGEEERLLNSTLLMTTMGDYNIGEVRARP
jgi:hypothetical protein